MNNQELEELSFRNLIWFHQEELRRIHDGENINDVIPCISSRRPLVKHGVMYRKFGQVGGSRLLLTENAIRVLESDDL